MFSYVVKLNWFSSTCKSTYLCHVGGFSGDNFLETSRYWLSLLEMITI